MNAFSNYLLDKVFVIKVTVTICPSPKGFFFFFFWGGGGGGGGGGDSPTPYHNTVPTPAHGLLPLETATNVTYDPEHAMFTGT